MEHSNLSFSTWLFCIKYMTFTKKSISALEMQRLLGLKRYEPVWYMMHKLRIVMGKRDSIYSLNDSLEIDEGFFAQKRGRGSQKQSKVLVMAESKKVDTKDPHKPDRKVGFIKMQVMKELTSQSINDQVAQKVKEVITKHSVLIEPNKSESAKQFPWVNRVISNAKKMLLGIHHNVIDQKYIQNYLNEFCYKFNRRYFGDKLHQRLVNTALNYTWN